MSTQLINFEVTYEWASSSGSVAMSTDIVKAPTSEEAKKKFLQRHDGERHKIMEIRSLGTNS
jgi:hypothetical protein